MKCKPPNRPAHDKFLEEISSRIQGHEERRKFLQERQKQLRESLQKCRADRDQIHEDRNVVDLQLATINKEVNEKGAELQKLRSNLPYLNEEYWRHINIENFSIINF